MKKFGKMKLCFRDQVLVCSVNTALHHYFLPSCEVCPDSIEGITMRAMISTFMVIALELAIHASSSLIPIDESRLERMNQHDRFVKRIPPLPWTIHEVVIAVRQKNLVRSLLTKYLHLRHSSRFLCYMLVTQGSPGE